MVKDLFVPCLEQSILYRRAAGYFTSFGLGLAARGIASLASRKGVMRLVASPHLESGDVDALRAASERPDDILRSIVSRSIKEIEEYAEIAVKLGRMMGGKDEKEEIGQAAIHRPVRKRKNLPVIIAPLRSKQANWSKNMRSFFGYANPSI
jgi:hypothetical protein